jgi:lipoate-protein ligase A
MKPIRLINLGAVPSWQTQAVYHALAKRMDEDGQDTIVICQPTEPYLCLGYHQVFESIFDPAECTRRGLPVYRRRLGGGATYLDKNQIFYQCIFHHTRMPAMLKDIYVFSLNAPVAALKNLGLDVSLHEVNEIEVGGKRIAGTGGGRIGDATVVVGNVLFDFNMDAMAAVWNAPDDSFRALAKLALREHIVTTKDLSLNITMDEMEQRLADAYAQTMKRPLEEGTLTPEEIQAAEDEARNMTSTDALALHKSDSVSEAIHTLKISARAFIRYDETTLKRCRVRGNFWVSEDIIRTCILKSNPEQDWRSAEQKLAGTNFSEWVERLAQ